MSVEKIKTAFYVQLIFFFEKRAVYEMQKNTAEPSRPPKTIWRMRIACWIPKATDTLRMCNTYCCRMETMVTLKRLRVTLHVDCLYC